MENAHFIHTHKTSPKISFPTVTKRVFADFRHKLGVPSPDTYYKEDHKRREDGSGEYGLAFAADKNSQHTSRNGKSISEKPARFDPHIDAKNG